MQDITLIVFAFLGAILGSFTTLLVHRLHFDEKGVIIGRSKCRHCHKTLKVLNLVPIFSWVFQRGKCSCGSKISVFYPLTEIIFVITFVIFAQKFSETAQFIPIMVALFFCLALFFYDV
jgi:leader peptidase (prepilin peptidase)/N-methyltransferase